MEAVQKRRAERGCGTINRASFASDSSFEAAQKRQGCAISEYCADQSKTLSFKAPPTQRSTPNTDEPEGQTRQNQMVVKQPKTYKKTTRPRTGPDPSTMLACEQYSQLVYNHIIGNRTPPPMRQVVVINQRRPTEYEGEITGCGMFSCTVQLRETYRSRWNRQFRQTSDNLGQSLENLGYMIGSASARAKLRRNAENQKEAKYKECLRSAGYR